MKPIVIYGAGGLAREIAALLEDINQQRRKWELLGFLSDDEASWGSELNGYPILGGTGWLLQPRTAPHVAIAIGNPLKRRRVCARIKAHVPGFPALRHPSAAVSRSAEICEGALVMALCSLTVNFRIGRFAVLNPGCTIAHDCAVGDVVTLAPGVHLSGNVTVGEGCEIGTGAAVIQGIGLGPWSVVGAGAVVTRDLPANCTAVGVPARVIKQREAGWHLAGDSSPPVGAVGPGTT